ncbi:MAG: TerB family tellurite resistance protein [Siculibacillus sp.]
MVRSREEARGHDLGDVAEEVVEEAAELRAGLWQSLGRALDFVGDLTGIGPLLDSLSTRVQDWLAGSGEVAFTVALISLAAKMAKADGVVSHEEITMFRRVVEVPPGEERNVERLFDLARRDVAGFEAHAARIAKIAGGDPVFLGDVLTGLFHIAAADSYVHEHELAFLERVGELFELDATTFERIASGFVRRRGPDPYRVLGVDAEASDEAVKKAWRRLVRECHPDLHFAHGLPHEATAILNDRLASVNGAWEQIRLERGL